MSDVKFNIRWNEHLEQYRESARRIDGEQIQFRFHIFPYCTTNEIVFKIDEWLRPGKGEDGHIFTPETYLHRIIFIGIINEIPIYSKGPKEGNALFVQDAERNAAYVGKLKLGCLMYIGPSSKETWKFEKYPGNT